MKLEELKIKAFDGCSDEYHYSEKNATLSGFFEGLEFLESLEIVEKRKNGIKIELFTGFKDKNGNDIYFGDKGKEWIPCKLLPDDGYWLESEVKQINGCAVLMQIGFDYSDCKFPDDFTFLYEKVTEIEIIK